MTETNKKYGLILTYMGGPENSKEVRPFLSNLFNDPNIIGIPQPIRFLVSRLIAYGRASKAIEHYNEIGGGSPLKKLTSMQANKVAEVIKSRGYNCTVTTGYSYCNPFIKDSISQFVNGDYEKIISIPLYPQYSITTFGSIERDLKKAARKFGLSDRLSIVKPYYNHDLYTRASVELVIKAIEKLDANIPYRVIFTAHALPQSVIDKGDPYRKQIEEAVAKILTKCKIDDYVLSFQSKIGPVKWMKPSTVETVEKAGTEGIKQLAVIPIGFTCDHVETLHELDIELAEIAHKAGIDKFVRGGVFNDHPLFIDLLTELFIGMIDE